MHCSGAEGFLAYVCPGRGLLVARQCFFWTLFESIHTETLLRENFSTFSACCSLGGFGLGFFLAVFFKQRFEASETSHLHGSLLTDEKLEFTGVSIKSQYAAIEGIHWLGTLSVYFKHPLSFG